MQRHALWGLLLFAAVAAACGSDPTGPVPDELVGRWEADPFCWQPTGTGCWFRIHDVANPADSLDLTDRFSANLRLDLERSGGFRFRLSAAGVDAFDESGDLTVEGGLLILHSTAGTDTLDYTLDGSYLRIGFRERLAFDFDGDGTSDDAVAVARLQHVE